MDASRAAPALLAPGAVAVKPAPVGSLVGKCFLHPFVDYLIIGGAISLPFLALVLWFPQITPIQGTTTFLLWMCVINEAHQAASAVRLYTKPGEVPARALLSWGFPVVFFVVVTLCAAMPFMAEQLWRLYLTWAPYHYAGQAYGLAVIYAFRSGCKLSDGEKRAMWYICLLPFFWAFLNSPDSGLAWFVNMQWLESQPVLAAARTVVLAALAAGICTAPLVLFARLWTKGKVMPVICILLMVVNSVWWVFFIYEQAVFWVTVAHSIQYLAIVTIYHVNDSLKRPNNTRGPAYLAVTFYAMCLVTGLTFFVAVPLAYLALGFREIVAAIPPSTHTGSAAVMSVVAAINLHHFIVDGFIWRNPKKPAAPPATPAPQPAAA
jgi:hypothetical protein